MNTSNDYYQNTDYRYTEIGIALTDFVYGDKVEIAIPVLTPFETSSIPVVSTKKISYDCIINEDRSFIHNSKASSCIITNNLIMTVPYYLADYIRSPNSHSECNHDDLVKLIWNGKKGTKFIISFVGGNLDKAQIIGRYYE